MINYQIIQDSIEFYSKNDFIRIEVPWLVNEYVDSITRPGYVQGYKIIHNNKNLVASAEQSFLYLYLKNHLPLGKFQAVTPCFRFNDSFDYLHSKYFIKNEIIQTDIVNEKELDKIVNLSYTFFSKYLDNLEIIKTNDGFDINYKNYELGSYGIRECEYLKWIYGTACAEPRLNRVINLYKKNINNS